MNNPLKPYQDYRNDSMPRASSCALACVIWFIGFAVATLGAIAMLVWSALK